MPEIPCPAPQPCPRLVWTDEGYVDPPGGACDECDGYGDVEQEPECRVCGEVSHELAPDMDGDAACPGCRETGTCVHCGATEARWRMEHHDGACRQCVAEGEAQAERDARLHDAWDPRCQCSACERDRKRRAAWIRGEAAA